MGIIYCYTNKSNGKRYIGQTTRPKNRKNEHLKEAKISFSTLFHKALREHGIDNFDYEVLEECPDDRVLLSERENHWIAHYNTLDPNGYNTASQICGLTESVREKIRQAHLGKKLSKEHKEKIRQSLQGRKYPNRILTIETKEKIRQTMLSKKYRLGKKHSKESKEKMSRAQSGKPRPHLLGKPLSDETKVKISQIKTGKIWIVNCISNQTRVIQKDMPIPTGWKKGRSKVS